jgi:ribose 5-phosphate isomerase A
MGIDQTATFKQQAAEYATQWVKSGMVIGLGTGSTAIWAVRRIGELLATGRLSNLLGIPSSSTIEKEARRLNIPLTTLNEHPVIDLTIDGADEVAPNLDAIKGGGGALFREKIVAQASQQVIVVIDDSKLSAALGTHWAVPVEVCPFGWRSQAAYLESLGAQVTMRENQDRSPFQTDQGNLILDCKFGPIAAPDALAARIKARAGIIEHGLFLGLVKDVIVGGPGGIRHLVREQP